MKSKFIRAFALVALSLTCAYCSAAAKTYAGGSGEAVKTGWAPHPLDAESFKLLCKPIVIYIYDSEPKNNPAASHLEGKDGLNNADLKEKLSKFTKIKLKADGTDAKGWDVFRKGAEKGASLIMMSSDMQMTVVFDKTKSAEERSLPAMISAATAIQAHDDKLHAAKQKEEKKAEIAEKVKEKEAEKEKGPDLTIKLDKKPDPPKKPVKPGDKAAADKAAAEKAAMDAKNGAGNAAADPKKKPPQDE